MIPNAEKQCAGYVVWDMLSSINVSTLLSDCKHINNPQAYSSLRLNKSSVKNQQQFIPKIPSSMK